MKSSPCRNIEVFDFNEDDDINESLAGKYSGKLPSPSSDDHALLTRDSLECVSQGTTVQGTKIADVPRVDADGLECHPNCGNATLHVSVDQTEEKIVSVNECYNNKLKERSLSDEERSEFRSEDDESRNFISDAEKRCLELKASSLAESQLNSDRLDSSCESEPIEVTSDVDESGARSSSSSPASGTSEDYDVLNGYALDHCSGDTEMDDMNMTVVLYPDYVIYRDSYCPGPHLIFSDCCIKIMGSTAHENQEAINFEWGLDDIVRIESQLYQRVETVMIKLQILSNNACEDVRALGTSGIEEVKIFVVEPSWCKKQEEIASLNQRYSSLWDHVSESEMGMGTDGDDSPRVRRYFPVFEESFEEVIYPKGDADAVSISKRDVDLLQPETFVNDTIIDFYIKYLKNQILPEERHKFHFFNSFFFRKLADLDKDPSSASDGAAAFQRVHKWTRKVDLFGKEFVFIPINFSLHWSLIVVCHPGEAATFTDECLDKSHKVPCILHMDSIKGNHAGLKHLIQSYLWEEWKERKKETSEEVSLRFHNLRFVSLELPQQENSFDCGLFLLHYLERFLAEVPDNFSPFKIEKPSNFLNSNWFPPTEASLKRALIQRLISELLKNNSQEVSSSASSDDDEIMESNENGVGSQFLSARFDPGPSCQKNNVSSSGSGEGIELTLLSASSMRNSHCINDSGLVLRNLFSSGAPDGSLMEQCQSFDQKSSVYCLNGTMSQLEEDPETGEQFMFGETEFHRLQLTGITPQTGGIPYPSKEYGGETFGMGISLQAEHGGIDCSSEPSIDASDDSSDVAITENFPVVEHSSLSQKERADELQSLAIKDIECAEGLISASCELSHAPTTAEASQNHDVVQSGVENVFPVSSFLEYHGVPVAQDSGGDVKMNEDDDMVNSKTTMRGQQQLDNVICSGVHNVEDGMVGLYSLESQPLGSGGNVVEISLVGLDSLGPQPADNGIRSPDDVHMVVDGSVIPDSPRRQSVGNVTVSGDTHVVAVDDLVGPDSPQLKPLDNRVCLVANSPIFEDAPVGLDSPQQQTVDNATGSGDDSQTFEDALVGLDSPGQKPADNAVGSGDNSQVFEDAPADLDSPGQQQADNLASLDDNIRTVEDTLLVTDSLDQQPTDKLLGSGHDVHMKEDGFRATRSLGQQQGENGLGSGDCLQMKEDGSVASNFHADQPDDNRRDDSLQQQPGQILIDLGNVPMIKHNSVAPDSPGQHPAKRPRLSPSEEDGTCALGSLTEN